MDEKIDEIVNEILYIYQNYGNTGYIGEQITQMEHALQSAYFAEIMQPNDTEFIIAALLHDIGHIIPQNIDNFILEQMNGFGIINHEIRGANYLLSKGFTQRIAYIVSNHVNAKRYLASKNISYMEHLSLASQETFTFQGGFMNNIEMKEIETHQWFDDIILLRYIDDRAKIVGLITKNINDYRILMLDILKQKYIV